MKYALLSITVCSLILNYCLWSGQLVPRDQVAATANHLAFSDPVAIMEGRE